jgi:two-component system sporulation sensor kinase A
MIPGIPAEMLLEALLHGLEGAGIGCTVMLERGGRMERVYANEALARILNLSLEETRSLSPREHVRPDERQRLEAMRAQFGTDGPGPAYVETIFRRRDGGDVPLELGLGYGMLQGARVTFTFVRDVSAKRAIAEALRESEERFRLVAETSPDSVTIFSIPKGRYVYANPVALRLLGIRSQDELGRVDPWGPVSAADRARIEARLDRVRAGEVLPPHQLRITTPDGKETILESSITFIQVEGGPALVSYTRDITERMLLQAELMKRDRLASVGLLAAGVAHELNNPLMSLGMQARMLRAYAESNGLPSEIRERLTHIDDAASRMAAIISDLLFMARPLEHPQAHVDVVQIVRSTIALLRAGVTSSPRIEVTIGELPAVQGYASKLGQVFFNVLRNAVQAIETVADGLVIVRARALADSIEIQVTDNGHGIPSALLPRVAQPFFSTKPGGTGLGLWLSHALIVQHGGTLNVASEEGKGTTVTLALPQNLPA